MVITHFSNHPILVCEALKIEFTHAYRECTHIENNSPTIHQLWLLTGAHFLEVGFSQTVVSKTLSVGKTLHNGIQETL